MIESISLSNFKAFKNLDMLKLKPITVLCGTNSCGKSSLMQSILLLKQTLENQNPSQTLLLNGRFAHLGSFENIINGKRPDDKVSFNIRVKFKKENFNSHRSFGNLPPIPAQLRSLLSDKNFYSPEANYILNFGITLKAIKEKNKKLFHSAKIEKWEFGIETLTKTNEILPKTDIVIKEIEENKYLTTWSNLDTFFGEGHGEQAYGVEFSNLIPSTWKVKTGDDGSRPSVAYSMGSIASLLKSIFASFTYVGPLREEPSRRYIYENEVIEIGIKGENAAYIYLTEELLLKEHVFYNKEIDGFVKKDKTKLQEAVTLWMDEFGVKNFKPEQQNEIIYLNMDSNSSKASVNIAEVGFGVSQLFPIVLEGLRMPTLSTLLLEQPEIHLHPKLQMKIADFFICLALSKKNVIIETHSDHIVNRLVRRIVEDDTGKLAELIGIYFISPSNNGPIIEEVLVDEYDGIVNWPPEFFDQVANEQEMIIKAGIKKRRNRKNNKLR
ncbi:AAA family ATPase [Heliobacterium undosum]|uniref:AAA family ATPase n=1 Tax=Heliomicrobium undosum TaxID=121734 RepID=A0A845LA43_9FIRM|nr:AAA family ATPase [Heliomicrobium undosum]MZP31490.1 AAA family ATPase [Heliomicrobium undosum]